MLQHNFCPLCVCIIDGHYNVFFLASHHILVLLMVITMSSFKSGSLASSLRLNGFVKKNRDWFTFNKMAAFDKDSEVSCTKAIFNHFTRA